MDAPEAARRVARFERSRDPRILWPEVTEHAFGAAVRELVRVASERLARPETRTVLRVEDPRSAAAFGPAAFASGLGPLLGYWIETNCLEAPLDLARHLGEHLAHGRHRAVRLREELERISAMFRAADIEVTVLKGMHTGWTYFPEPGTRPVSDIDLLIPPERAADAFRILGVAGFLRESHSQGRSAWRPAAQDRVVSVQLNHMDNPWTLDLHTSLDRRLPYASAPVRFGARSPEDLPTWNVGDGVVRILSQPLLACFLSVHASNHFPHLAPLRLVELVLMFRRDGGERFPWEQLADRIRRTGSGGFAYPALKLTEEMVPGTVSPALLDLVHSAADPSVRRVLRRTTPATAFRIHRWSFTGRLLWAGSGWRRLRLIVSLMWPKDADGKRYSASAVLGLTGMRIRRVLVGRLSRRAR